MNAVLHRGLENQRELRLVQRDEELLVVPGEPVGKEGREEELREGQDVDLAAPASSIMAQAAGTL